MRFKDKVVVITGAAQGLGAYYALRFAAEGAKVALGDVADCAASAAAVTEQGGTALAHHCDVTKAASAGEFIAKVASHFGRLDALVNNAALYGALTFGPFEAIAEEEWDACMAVNVKGVWQMAKAALPAMTAGGGGSIVNIASLAATYGMPYGVHYSASKGAVIGFTRALAREVARHDIRVNAVAPSLIATPGTEKFLKDKAARVTQAVVGGQAIRRQLTEEDIAGVVLFLASDEAKFMTGQTLAVDGGTVML
ncbi:MAG: SDR family NAD(P)-dependent oxidoreductase [Pseudomonadota bacterium]